MDPTVVFAIQAFYCSLVFLILVIYLALRRVYTYTEGAYFFGFFVLGFLWVILNTVATLTIVASTYRVVLVKVATVIGEFGILLFMFYVVGNVPYKSLRYALYLEEAIFGFLLYSNIIADVEEVSSSSSFVFFIPSYTPLGSIAFIIYLSIELFAITFIALNAISNTRDRRAIQAFKTILLGFWLAYLGGVISAFALYFRYPLTIFPFIGTGASIIVFGYSRYSELIYMVPPPPLFIGILNAKTGTEIWSYSKLEDHDPLVLLSTLHGIVKLLDESLKISGRAYYVRISGDLYVVLMRMRNLLGVVITRVYSDFVVKKLRGFLSDAQKFLLPYKKDIITVDISRLVRLEELFKNYWSNITRL